MKPLLLRMQAFGPFAGVQEIDFRVLGERTFFLIHGPTGSGKTSVLDGLCFALFGDSSGGEREVRQMRSHHADAGVLTEISLEFALGEDRYRVLRIPEQTRKALRGGGEVRQAPKAELLKLEGEGAERVERPLASGWSRVNEQVVRLLGFESRQFRQVIVLPQGRFFEFLKAGSQEREKILQVLFGTELYKRIEESLKRAADELQARARDLRSHREALLQQAAAADEAELDARQALQQQQLAGLRGAEQEVAQASALAESQLAQARQVADRFAEFDAAREALAQLQSQQAGWAQQRHRLDAMRRAARLRPAEGALQQARQDFAEATDDLARRASAFEGVRAAHEAAQAQLATQQARGPQRDQLLARIAQLEGLQERVASLAQSRREHQDATRRQQQTAQSLDAALRRREQARQWLQALQDRLQRLAPEAAALEGARLALAQGRSRQAQLTERARLLAQSAREEAALRRQQAERDAAQAGREQAAQARREALAAWLAGQSARIARELAEGEPCPVCGSQQHPAPAHAGGEIVQDALLAAAEQAQERADAQHAQALEALAAARQRLAETGGRLEALAQALGPDAIGDAALSRELKSAEAALARAQAAERELREHAPRLAAVQREAAEADAAAQDEAGRAEGECQRSAGRLAEREQGIPAELATPAQLAQALQQLNLQAQAWREELAQAEADARQAATERARLEALCEEGARGCTLREQALREAERRFEQALAQAGFAEATDYEQARADDAAQQALEQDIAAFDQALASALARHERAAGQTAALTRPHLAACEDHHRQAQARWIAASNAVRDALAALEATGRSLAALGRIAQDHQAIEQRHAVLRSLSDAAVGHNPQRMSFQRYVLATLLEEVLAATTLRLRVMSRGRYEMRRRLAAGDARAAGGLDLEVFDHYTGSARGVDTLSGGESFLASLALALGLSDVVQSHAGGIRLDAIFVDEGFGTLDPEALDFAIRTLKDLQQSGRMVGIISHVAELKDWIDARLELRPSQAGSHARFVF